MVIALSVVKHTAEGFSNSSRCVLFLLYNSFRSLSILFSGALSVVFLKAHAVYHLGLLFRGYSCVNARGVYAAVSEDIR